MTAEVYDFSERLRWSESNDTDAVYGVAYPDLAAAVKHDNIHLQKAGVDRIVTLKSGRVLYVEEKHRSENYGDILLEVWSVWYSTGHRDNKPGWACDPSKITDEVLYIVWPASRVYRLYYPVLREAFKANGRRWIKEAGGMKSTPNKGYKTKNVPVPWDELNRAMREVCVSGVS